MVQLLPLISFSLYICSVVSYLASSLQKPVWCKEANNLHYKSVRIWILSWLFIKRKMMTLSLVYCKNFFLKGAADFLVPISVMCKVRFKNKAELYQTMANTSFVIRIIFICHYIRRTINSRFLIEDYVSALKCDGSQEV